MYDSGQMQYDGDQGADFEGFNQGNFNGFTQSGNNGNFQTFYTSNMGGGGNINP